MRCPSALLGSFISGGEDGTAFLLLLDPIFNLQNKSGFLLTYLNPYQNPRIQRLTNRLERRIADKNPLIDFLSALAY